MSFGTALVIIFAIAAIVWLRAQKHRANLGSSAPDAELEREVEQLRQRIAVLERIAIEERGGSERLAREIEALRD